MSIKLKATIVLITLIIGIVGITYFELNSEEVTPESSGIEVRHPKYPKVKTNTNSPKQYFDILPNVQDLHRASNEARLKMGFSELTLDARLNRSALAKCNDMVLRDYWSHEAPDGSESWVFLKQQGVPYGVLGENLAYGFTTSVETVNNWLNSPTHREQLLGSNYNIVGYGVCTSQNYRGEGQQTIVVQHFYGPF